MINQENKPQEDQVADFNEVDVKELLLVLWKRKLTVISITLVFTFLTVIAAMSMTNYFYIRELINCKRRWGVFFAFKIQWFGLFGRYKSTKFWRGR